MSSYQPPSLAVAAGNTNQQQHQPEESKISELNFGDSVLAKNVKGGNLEQPAKITGAEELGSVSEKIYRKRHKYKSLSELTYGGKKDVEVSKKEQLTGKLSGRRRDTEQEPKTPSHSKFPRVQKCAVNQLRTRRRTIVITEEDEKEVKTPVHRGSFSNAYDNEEEPKTPIHVGCAPSSFMGSKDEIETSDGNASAGFSPVHRGSYSNIYENEEEPKTPIYVGCAPSSFMGDKDEIEASGGNASAGFSLRLPSQDQRSADDRTIGMEDIFRNEYGSNTTLLGSPPTILPLPSSPPPPPFTSVPNQLLLPPPGPQLSLPSQISYFQHFQHVPLPPRQTYSSQFTYLNAKDLVCDRKWREGQRGYPIHGGRTLRPLEPPLNPARCTF